MSRASRRWSLAASAAACALVAGSFAAPALAADPAPAVEAAATGTFTNPVSAGVGDTFADPAVVRGKDGWWYAVGTTDPLREGEGERHLLPTARSRDLVTWSYVGDAFTEATLPAWADLENGASALGARHPLRRRRSGGCTTSSPRPR